jgi:hypothetical protein
VEEQLKEKERTDEKVSRAEYHMELALGEKLSQFTEKEIAPVIAKGRTSAGTTFVIRASVGNGPRRSCQHEVEIELHEGNGWSDGGVCLSEGARSQPFGGCSGAVETVKLATPPDARRARVRFSDGRTVTVAIVQVPVKDGGPAGVFIDAFRGYNPYPVSVQELSHDGRVLRTVSPRRSRKMRVYSGGRPRRTSAESRKKHPVNKRISGPPSSIPRAPLQAGGHRFDPGWLHSELTPNRPVLGRR